MNKLAEIETYAHENGIPILLDEGLRLLIQICKENDYHSFLEIGTAIGRTSIVVAGLQEDMRVVTIERDEQMIRQAQKNIEASACANRITLIKGDALTVENPQGPFDCIFIDAAKAQYTRFFHKYAPLLSENGVIVSDNMKFHGFVDHPERTQNRNTKALVRKIRGYREFLKALPDYETVFCDKGDGIALTRKK